MILNKRQLSLSDARKRILNYCAKQERSHGEVRDKLKNWGIHPDHIDELIVYLIENNFLNEERFARAFASGKIRIKSWGKIKVRNRLREKGVSAYSIDQAMGEIEDKEYLAVIRKAASRKKSLLVGLNDFEKNSRLRRFLLQRGYEPDLVRKVMDEI
jgi:regulatory protein